MKNLFQKCFFWVKHLKKRQVDSQPVNIKQESQEAPVPEIVLPKSIPDRNAHISEWEEFVTTNGWERIHRVFMRFVPMVNDAQDHAIWNLLHDSLCKLELPVLSSNFIKYYDKQIITVDDNSSTEQTKETVAQIWPTMESPCFVVKQSGELIGFAISPTLVIAGITPVACSAKNALKLVKDWDKHLLSAEDSRVVETSLHQLNELMQQAQVPHIKCSDWLIAADEQPCVKSLKGYDVNHDDRLIRYSANDHTNILVKI